MSRSRWYERVGPRESLTVTATEREVDGWRVAAVIAGEKLAEWAVAALNEAARVAIAKRVSGEDPAPVSRPPTPGSWGAGYGPRARELGVPRPAGRVVTLPPAPTGPPQGVSRVSIPAEILAGVEAVRRSGLTNMLDGPAVLEIAGRLGFSDTARWIRENPAASAVQSVGL